MAFSPDGQLLATGGQRQDGATMDPATGEHRRTLTGLTGKAVDAWRSARTVGR